MKDWRINYKKDFLCTLINRKRQDDKVVNYVDGLWVNNLVRKTMRAQKITDELEAINYLIDQVRQNKLK